jgi:DNA helicase HerA-like ATPase
VDVASSDDDAQDLVFARVVSKLREHLERRDLGVQHVVVFVDELNKYAPADGPDTYVRKMLLDIAERGRYLGLVLFAAQQFRSQVHRRIVGNAGTTVYGRMDGDELATPGYATLGPALRTRLATLEKGQLMVRHPHFTQPVFLRFPRPAVLSGRAGIERFPPAVVPSLDVAIARQLRALDPAITAGWVQRVVGWDGESAALYEEAAIVRALRATLRARPEDVRATFERELRRGARAPVRDPGTVVRPVPLATARRGDPFGD